jgi:hypothetical protein
MMRRLADRLERMLVFSLPMPKQNGMREGFRAEELVRENQF